MFNKEYFVLVTPQGKLIALDRDSGGYPYNAVRPKDVHYWDSWRSANTYRNTMNKPEWKIQKISFTLEDVTNTPTVDVRPGQVWENEQSERYVILNVTGFRVEAYFMWPEMTSDLMIRNYRLDTFADNLVDGGFTLL